MGAMSEVVRSYYDREVEREWGRLDRPYRRLELVTTLQLVSRYFPVQGHLADIGGGPGRYTVELLRRGFRVTLVDLSPRAVAFAQAKLAELGLEAEAILCADARDLAVLPPEAFDGALLMGPLYHIVDEAGRAQALAELGRRHPERVLATNVEYWAAVVKPVNDESDAFLCLVMPLRLQEE